MKYRFLHKKHSPVLLTLLLISVLLASGLLTSCSCKKQEPVESTIATLPTETTAPATTTTPAAPDDTTKAPSTTPGQKSDDASPATVESTTVPPETSTREPSPEEIYDPITNPHPKCPELTWLNSLEIPAWDGQHPYAVLNNNYPLFDTKSLKPESYEIYYELDELGRCTLADAVVGQDTQPTEKRGDIGSVKPTGWHSDRYNFVNGGALYNRCHLLAYYLTAENANERNLVTGTSYMNRDGMNDFENLVGDYVKETGNHVRYRVTPKWTGNNLICDGLLVEGYSIEDEGDSICFCIYAYNVQPGVYIDYLTGDNHAENEEATSAVTTEEPTYVTTEDDVFGTYILNVKKLKFHRPDCEGVKDISDKNKKEYTGSRNALILDGYVPCGACNP